MLPTVSQQPFARRVKDALADPKRLEAIRRAADRFNDGRRAALAALPDPDATRDLARRIRAHTIANLDRYLEQFSDSVTKAGGQVHWARDAAEACAIVTGIAQAAGVSKAVKSKSMLSEEIGLNPALEGAGLQVVETDLGEYIIQLAEDRPSHIIAPVLHRTRHEVSALFAEKLGAEPTDDIAELNKIARRTLRDAFLSADMGISGCNFGVAETGTVCLVTNEGNGRMVTSLPRVYVALVGIERLAPTLADLSVLLQVLARSATGQKMSVYTSLVTGPRRADEPHGPQEMHVVLVDNGRTRALASELAEILYCIRCGACLNVCPVYRTIGGHAYGSVYPGPIGSVVSPILGGLAAFPELPHASTLCGACREVCPVRIDLPALLLRLRRDTARRGLQPAPIGVGLRAFKWSAMSAGRFRLVVRLGYLATRILGRGGWVRRLPGPLAAWTAYRDFPPLAGETFTQRWERKEGRR